MNRALPSLLEGHTHIKVRFTVPLIYNYKQEFTQGKQSGKQTCIAKINSLNIIGFTVNNVDKTTKPLKIN